MVNIFINIIVILSIFAVLRILVGLFLSNIHEIKTLNISQNDQDVKHHSFDIIIPAYNEEDRIRESVLSALNVNYDDYNVIVVNDGSTDNTLEILLKIQEKYPKLKIVNQENKGKSEALNHALFDYSTHELVMVLDADSTISQDALIQMNNHFKNRRTLAVSANVRIENPKNIIEYVQFIEYILGYHLKNSEVPLNLEYIIGGIGSTFRRSALLEVNGYDVDTITEDIDLTMKLLHHFGNTHYYFEYANNVICFTPPVHTFKELLKQRLRWKMGRFKSLMKYHQMIFSYNSSVIAPIMNSFKHGSNKKTIKYSLTLSWWKLPKVWLEEVLMFLEPIISFSVLGAVIRYGDITSYLSIILLYTIYATFSFINEDKLSLKNKILIFVSTPFTFFFLEIISLVDYISLLRCIINPKKITENKSSWEHVQR